MKKKLVLGDEYDSALRQALLETLTSLGADIDARQWGLGAQIIAGTMKLILSAPSGQGIAAAQVFEK